MKPVLERETWLRDTLAGLGYELVDLESSRGGLVRVFIDSPRGITVEDCARVSNHLTRAFAAEGIDYERLEVSSPGLDRVLRVPAHYQRFVGERVQVELAVARDGRRRYTGRLLRCEPQGIVVEVDGVEVSAGYGEIAQTRLVPQWPEQSVKGRRK